MRIQTTLTYIGLECGAWPGGLGSTVTPGPASGTIWTPGDRRARGSRLLKISPTSHIPPPYHCRSAILLTYCRTVVLVLVRWRFGRVGMPCGMVQAMPYGLSGVELNRKKALKKCMAAVQPQSEADPSLFSDKYSRMRQAAYCFRMDVSINARLLSRLSPDLSCKKQHF